MSTNTKEDQLKSMFRGTLALLDAKRRAAAARFEQSQSADDKRDLTEAETLITAINVFKRAAGYADTMSRADFSSLTPAARMVFVNNGGKVV